ncbi:hypothetical protein [Brucella sp. 09RB8471]|uniref:hypothetical protein n=1 Tax=Brucella sp. 09RB8471 TaxID=1149952 RepID=UPI0012EBB4ED|nr:hypothetical protein [Brucella sp. 09RB8471]
MLLLACRKSSNLFSSISSSLTSIFLKIALANWIWIELPEAPGAGGAASFAADGKAVDPSDMQLHAKAIAYQKANPGTAYLDAVSAVS